jgi:hypothetical protein
MTAAALERLTERFGNLTQLFLEQGPQAWTEEAN